MLVHRMLLLEVLRRGRLVAFWALELLGMRCLTALHAASRAFLLRALALQRRRWSIPGSGSMTVARELLGVATRWRLPSTLE